MKYENFSIYTEKELRAEARRMLDEYRKRHNDRIRRYVFADTPWTLTITNGGVSLVVQIKDKDSGWIENNSIAL